MRAKALFIFLLLLSTLLPVLASCSECEHQWNEGYVAEHPTDKKEGYKIFTCNLCAETKSEVIEKLTHAKHDFTKAQWASDRTNHWMVCDFAHCDATTVKGVHLYTSSTDGGYICLICKSNDNTHSFTSNQVFDENFHWIACNEEDCPTMASRLPHTLDGTGKCTGCGYTAVHEAHVYTKWDINENTHRLLCSFEGCDASTEESAHSWIEENGAIICRDCRTVNNSLKS